jgi:two-component system chemotaxis response regulator CheY
MHILVVDDSKVIHSYIESILANHGHTMIHAFSGDESLAIITKDHGIDLVLLDWEMPGLTGPETVKSAREQGFEKPIIMITTKNKTEDIRYALSQGANDYIMKPFTDDILLGKIAAI